MYQDTDWVAKAKEIYDRHIRGLRENPGWTIYDTKRVTGCSVGYVSESLAIMRFSFANPKILKCKNRQEAIGYIRPHEKTFAVNTRVMVLFGTREEPGIILGRGTVPPRDIVWIVKLDMPFFFDRVSKRMDTVIAKAEHIKEINDCTHN